jgi:hypothetical protein
MPASFHAVLRVAVVIAIITPGVAEEINSRRLAGDGEYGNQRRAKYEQIANGPDHPRRPPCGISNSLPKLFQPNAKRSAAGGWIEKKHPFHPAKRRSLHFKRASEVRPEVLQRPVRMQAG